MFSVSLAFTMLSGLPAGLNFPAKMKVCHCASKTGGCLVFHGRYPQVEVEQLEYCGTTGELWKLYTADGGGQEGEESG